MKMDTEWDKRGIEIEDEMMRDKILTEGAVDGEARPAHGQITSEAMAKEIRSWAKWLLGFGVFNLLLSGYSGGFGVLLIIVGLACLKVHVAGMFVIIAVTFAWAAVSNLMGLLWGNYEGIIWAIVQVALVFRTFGQYRDYRRGERQQRLAAAHLHGTGNDRLAYIFPLGSCLLSALAVPSLVAVIFLIGMMMEFNHMAEPPGFLIFAADVLVNLGILGIALGVASLLSGYRYKPLAIAGALAGSLIAAAYFYLILSG